MTEPTDEQMKAFEAMLLQMAATNSYSAQLLMCWIMAQSRDERVAIMRHLAEAAAKIATAFHGLGLSAQRAGEQFAQVIAEGVTK